MAVLLEGKTVFCYAYALSEWQQGINSETMFEAIRCFIDEDQY